MNDTIPSIKNTNDAISLNSIFANTTSNGSSSSSTAAAAVAAAAAGSTTEAAVLCNDPSGLCLGSRGSIDTSRSGLYTKIARLASQLDPYDYSNSNAGARGVKTKGTSTTSSNPNKTAEMNVSNTSRETHVETDVNNEIKENVVHDSDNNGTKASGNSNGDGSSLNAKAVVNKPTNKNNNELEYHPPFISIETERAAIFIKTYDGHTIVLRMPTPLQDDATNANSNENQMIKTIREERMDEKYVYNATGDLKVNEERG